MEEKFKYIFIGFICTTIIYALIAIGVIFVASRKIAKIDENPIKEMGHFTCDSFNNVSTTFNNGLVLNDGYLYAINTNMNFSNGQNCKKISDIKIVKAIDNLYVAEDGSIYTYEKDSDELKSYDATGRMPSYLLGSDIVKAVSYGANYENKYYVLKTDGKIYKVRFNKELDRSGKSYNYTVVRDEVYMYYDDEAITSFSVTDKNVSLIVTNKSIYTNKIVNTECMQYADVECELEFAKNEVLKESMDNIKYINVFNNSIIYIDSNDNMYNFNMLGV